MQNSNTLWILPTIKKDKYIYEPFWIPYPGRFEVNIIYVDEPVNNLLETIKRIRVLRVGNEAQFPKIKIWLRIQSISNKLIYEISKLDRTVPMIKIVVVDMLGRNAKETEGILLNAQARYLSTEILVVSYGNNVSSFNFEQYQKITTQAYFEWFLIGGDFSSLSGLKEIIHKLDGLGYNFAAHPLTLCGGVALICREILLSRFGVSCNPKDSVVIAPTDSFKSYKEYFDNVIPNCLFGAVSYLFSNDIIPNNLGCSCGINLKIASNISELIERDRLIQVKKYRLFEDWQYIYDGFDLL